MSLTEPLNFELIYVEKVWGGSSLAPFLGHEPSGEGPVGEVWALVDRDDVSSVVARGEYEGRTLGGLILSAILTLFLTPVLYAWFAPLTDSAS